MKVIADPGNALAQCLSALRAEYQVPERFPPAVIEATEAVAHRAPTGHADRTALSLVTLDPASSTDLDQAFAIEPSGGDLLLHYAIADMNWSSPMANNGFPARSQGSYAGFAQRQYPECDASE